MEPTLLIAGYAAVVATSGIAWQIFTWRHSRRSHVEVRVRYGVAAPVSEVMHLISIEGRNQGDRAVRVTGVGLDLQDGSGDSFQRVYKLDFATLPGRIEPFDSGTGFIPVAEAEGAGIDPFEPVTAWVRLATGEVVKSPATQLRSRD